MTVQETTQAGVAIEFCDLCNRRHPVAPMHCTTCGSPSMFPHSVHGGVT